MNILEEDTFLKRLEAFSTVQDLAIFQLQTGTRVGEAAVLEFKQIDFFKKEVRICQHLHWERKSKGQILQVSRTEIVFPYGTGWLHYRTIQSLYDRAFKLMGSDLSGTHCLRHTFAVRFLDQTKDIYALQRILGHKDLETTQVYAKYSNESVRKSFQLFNGGKKTHVFDLVTKSVTKL